MKILVIGATHGDELLGPKLYQRLLSKRSSLLEYIDFIIGNPRAFAAKKRYIEQDLNRSYHDQTSSCYEASRAKEIIDYIAQTKPDIVLDMHTTSCKQPNCLILSSVDGSMVQRMLGASHISTLLQVQPMGDIATLDAPVIGYEVTNASINASLLDAVISDLERFVTGEMLHPNKELFVMSGKIYKSEYTPEQASTFVNFQMHQLRFVPIMTGNNSYKKQTDYLGFKSEALKKIVIE